MRLSDTSTRVPESERVIRTVEDSTRNRSPPPLIILPPNRQVMAQSSAPEDSESSDLEDQTLPDAPPANLLEEAADSNGAKGADGTEDANKMSLDGMFDDEDEDDEFTTSSNISRGLDTRLTEPVKLTSKIDVKLEDLFKDEEDEDDEFFSGPRATEKVEESSPPPSSPPFAPL